MKLLGYLNILKEILKLYSQSLLMKTDYLTLSFVSCIYSTQNGRKGNVQAVAGAIVTFSPWRGHDPAKKDHAGCAALVLICLVLLVLTQVENSLIWPKEVVTLNRVYFFFGGGGGGLSLKQGL